MGDNMEVKEIDDSFKPITITLHSKEELDMLWTSLNVSEYTFKKHMTDCDTRTYNPSLQTRLDALREGMWRNLAEYFN